MILYYNNSYQLLRGRKMECPICKKKLKKRKTKPYAATEGEVRK